MEATITRSVRIAIAAGQVFSPTQSDYIAMSDSVTVTVTTAGAEYNNLPVDYYISTTGSDSNAGTSASPWALTAINTKRVNYAGKVVGLMDGTYDLVAIMGQPTSSFDTGSLAIAAGSSGTPTIIVSQTRNGAIIDWNRAAVTGTGNAATGASMQPNGDYVTIDGLKFVRNNYRTICNYTGGGNHLTVKNCWFTDHSYTVGPTGANACCIYTQGYTDLTVSNCRFDGIDAPIDGNRSALIKTYATTTRAIIEYCTFYAISGTEDLINLKNGGSESPTIRYCYFDASARTSAGQTDPSTLKLTGSESTSNHLTVQNSIFIGDGTNPHIRAYTDSTNQYEKGIYDLFNNTFVGNTSVGGIIHLEAGPPTQANFYNNILYRTVAPSSYGDVNFPALALLGTVDHNLYAVNSALKIQYNGTSVSGLASWQSTSGKDANSPSSITDPTFVAAGSEADYYALQSGSAGHNAGSDGTDMGAWGSGATQVGSTV